MLPNCNPTPWSLFTFSLTFLWPLSFPLCFTLTPTSLFIISACTFKHPTFPSRQWRGVPSRTSRFSTPQPTVWTSAGRLPRAQSNSTGWSTLLWQAPGHLSRWVSIRCGRRCSLASAHRNTVEQQIHIQILYLPLWGNLKQHSTPLTIQTLRGV